MRFLYVILGVIWLVFGWTCVEALRWEKPLPTPVFILSEVRSASKETINQEIEQLDALLSSQSSDLRERSVTYLQLGDKYFVKAFLFDNRNAQIPFLKLSVEKYQEALRLSPNQPILFLRLADAYALLGVRDKAEDYYAKTIAADIRNEDEVVRRMRMLLPSDDRRR
ncbi:MAG: hypothetical protein GC154_06295 [bacterium]|nr:hypothetical protein [bacterium]